MGIFCARARIRTWDPTSISGVLYQLSYTRIYRVTEENIAEIEINCNKNEQSPLIRDEWASKGYGGGCHHPMIQSMTVGMISTRIAKMIAVFGVNISLHNLTKNPSAFISRSTPSGSYMSNAVVFMQRIWYHNPLILSSQEWVKQKTTLWVAFCNKITVLYFVPFIRSVTLKL